MTAGRRGQAGLAGDKGSGAARAAPAPAGLWAERAQDPSSGSREGPAGRGGAPRPASKPRATSQPTPGFHWGDLSPSLGCQRRCLLPADPAPLPLLLPPLTFLLI